MRHGWRWRGPVAAAGTILLFSVIALYAAAPFSFARPHHGPLSELPAYTDSRDSGFAALLRWADMRDDEQLLLKVYFGWSQNVWIVLQDMPNSGSRVAMLEQGVNGDEPRMRTFALSRRDSEAILREFDEAALGYRLFRLGLDGREISFERRLGPRIVSYAGNASFSDKDAAMARVVDQFVAAHGGYADLNPDNSGRNWRARRTAPSGRRTSHGSGAAPLSATDRAARTAAPAGHWCPGPQW